MEQNRVYQADFGKIVIPHDHQMIPLMLASYGVWEKHLVETFKKYVTKDSIVIDIGAHMGIHTIRLANLSKKVFAFEPLDVNFQFLKQNIYINKLDNVDVFNVGLGNEECVKRVLWSVRGDTGQSGLEGCEVDADWKLPEKSVSQQDAILKCLDSYCDIIDKVDLIKIDTEGYERLTLLGGEKMINRDRPVIIFESNTPKTRDMIIKMMEENWNYSITKIHGNDFLALPN